MDSIAGYYRHIDGCTAEISKLIFVMIILTLLTIFLNILLLFLSYTGDCERNIVAYRARIKMQQQTIRTRRDEVFNMRLEADRLRIDVDHFCIQVGDGRQEAARMR